MFQSKLSRKSLVLVHNFHRPLDIPNLKMYCKLVRDERKRGSSNHFQVGEKKANQENDMLETNMLV